MSKLKDIKDQISILGRAEYRYDRLVSDFSEHYLELVDAGYKRLPEMKIFDEWLRHLHLDIRPSLRTSWEKVATEFGFKLGSKITIEHPKRSPVELYAIRISCYPLENIFRVTGFGVKKDGKPSSASVTAELDEQSTVKTDGKTLDQSVLEPLFFEGTSRLPAVKKFIEDAIGKLR